MIAKNVLKLFFINMFYLANSAFIYALMKSNATCSGLILSFHHTQKITVVYF